MGVCFFCFFQILSYDFPAMGFSLYFLERPRDGKQAPSGNSRESERYLWNMHGVGISHVGYRLLQLFGGGGAL